MRPIYMIPAILALLMTIVSACYEDKGNYDYLPYKRVVVEVGNNYGIKQPEEAIEYTITPKVVMSDGSTDLSNLSFLWKMSRRSNQGGEQFGDTVSTGPNVSITIDPNDEKTFSYEYYFRFYVTDNETGVKEMFPVNLKVIKPYENSWVVLHNVDGHAEIGSVEYANGEIIVTPDALSKERAKDVEMAQGPLTGKPVSLGRRQVAIPSYYATDWLGLTGNQLYVSTTNPEESGLLNQAEHFRLLANWERIIYPVEKGDFGSDDVHFCNSYQAGFLCSHGQLFQGCMYSVLMYGMHPDDEVASEGDYYIEKAYALPNAGIAFDSKQHRFLMLSIQGNYWSGNAHTGTPPSDDNKGFLEIVPKNPKNAADPSAVNPDLKLVDFTAGYWYGKSLMAAWQRMGANAFLLNEKTGKSSVYVFHGYPLTSSYDPDDIPVTGLYSIDTPDGVTTDTPMTSSWEFSNILFYAVGNKIYRLDFAVTGGSSTVIYQHPDPNAQITCLQMAYEEAQYIDEMPDGMEIYGHPYERTIAAGVNLPDNTGEVVVLQLNTAGKVDNDAMYPAIQEHKGFGAIKDLTFI